MATSVRLAHVSAHSRRYGLVPGYDCIARSASTGHWGYRTQSRHACIQSWLPDHEPPVGGRHQLPSQVPASRWRREVLHWVLGQDM